MNKKSKVFPVNKLVTIFIVLFILGGFLVITSGVFYEPAPRFSGMNQTSGHSSSNSMPGTKSPQIKALEKEVERDPTNFNNVLKLAHQLGDNGFYLEAITRYDQYLEKFPNIADVIVDKGVCYFNMKNYSKASEVMKSALKINSKHEIAHLNLGVVNMAAGNKDEAVMWWNKLIKISPNSDYAKRAKELINSH